jgi:hypothetical protein
MSDVIQKLQRMLAQAQVFAKEAPLEAVARAQQAAREAEAALSDASGKEREELELLRAMALMRAEKYEARLEGWTRGVQERAELFTTHESQRLQQAIPSKD